MEPVPIKIERLQRRLHAADACIESLQIVAAQNAKERDEAREALEGPYDRWVATPRLIELLRQSGGGLI